MEQLTPIIYYYERIGYQRLRWDEGKQRVKNGNNRTYSPIMDYLLFFYSAVYTFRYLLSSYAIFTNNSSYFEWDIVMDAVKRKNRFDHLVFFFISIMFPYNSIVHYVRYYRTDYLILDTQYQIVMGNFHKFVQYFPQYNIDFKNKNIFAVASKMIRNIVQLKRNMKFYDSGEQNTNSKQPEKWNSMARLVIFMMKNELINLFIYVIFSKKFFFKLIYKFYNLFFLNRISHYYCLYILYKV